MKLAALSAPDFDLEATMLSGQVFHWRPENKGWSGLVGRVPVHVSKKNSSLLVTAGSEMLVSNYFSLDHPLPAIYDTFPKDPYSLAALESCRGLRIIRQPRWECLATFITSSMKQVAHIRAMSFAIREKFGDPIVGSSVHAYPEPTILAGASEADLRACGLGFRARNLLLTATKIAAGDICLSRIAAMETPRALEELCKLPGVGVKVANCVLLFAYERLDAVPIDVWIGRILNAMRHSRPSTPAQLARFSRRRFGNYAGYVQQYLFHHARLSKTLPAA